MSSRYPRGTICCYFTMTHATQLQMHIIIGRARVFLIH